MALERHWSANTLMMLTNDGLDQSIGAVAAPVQNLDGILLGIEKDEEIIMPEQAHLLNSFIFAHGQNNELFAPAD